VKRFIYLFCLVAFFNFVSVLQAIIYFNSIIKYIVPVLFFITSLTLYLKSKPNWLITNTDKVVYYLFAGFTFYLLIGSIRFEVFYIQEFFVGELYLLPYLLPLFMINITLEPANLKLYFSIIKKLLLPGLLILLVIVTNLNFENWYFHVHLYELFLFGFPIIFLLMGFFQSKKLKILLYIIFILMLFIAAFYGRRSLLGDIIFLFAFLQLIQISSKTVSKITLALRYSLLFLIITPIILLYSENITQLSVFQRGFGRDAWDESRGLVMLDFFEDFVSTRDWAIGRGLNGQVKRTIGDSNDNGFGTSIENGYLTVVLKGGNVYFFFILYFFLRAIYLGWFKSNNDFTKAFAALLLIHLLGMIGFNIPIFNHRYMLLWLSIPICFSAYYRSLTNQLVKQLIIPR
jgi:hypothetical protein